MNMNFDDQYDPLCCCEYFDRNNERNHILGCCCNCVDLDQVFENFICCRPINRRQKESMFSTMFDRIRVPWRGGAKLISVDCLVPFLLNPLIFLLATNNLICTLISFVILWIVILKANRYFAASRGRFHYFWALSTVIYLVIIFETLLPLYEFLPEENVIFVILFLLSLGLFYRTKDLSSKHRYGDFGMDNSSKDDDSKILISDNDDNSGRISQDRHRSQSDYYNCWIDAHVDKTNQKYYILGLILTIISFTIYSNLTLTAVCHPYLFTTIFHIPISVPDDCFDVYDLFDVAIGFIAGLYGVVVCLVAVFYLFKHLVLMYYGRRHNATLKV